MTTECQIDHDRSFGFTILGSGSSGNATVIHAPEGNFLLDAGFSAKELERRMQCCEIAPDSIEAILITHEHTDHATGCRVFADRYGIPAYLTAGTEPGMSKRNWLPEQRVFIEPGNVFTLCGLEVEPFSIPHDVPDAVAFTFRCDDRKLGYATDLGMAGMLVISKLCQCKALVLESNYEPALLMASDRRLELKRRIMSRHGHLSNIAAMEMLGRVLEPCTDCLIFAHLSQECNDADLVEKNMERILDEMNRKDVTFRVARQDRPLETFWI